MDWNLRSCGRHGHVTYAPDEPDLRAHLHARTAIGSAWRCLRCGDFVLGEPHGSGPAELAPTVIRGRGLRDMVILRLLSVERLIRGLIVLLVAYGVFQFRGHRGSVEQAFNDDLPLIQNLADKFHWDVYNSSIVEEIRRFIEADTKTLAWVAGGLAVYGVLQLVEATGLWLLKRWGEYFAVVATSLFIPLEVYELVAKITWFRAGALLINVAAVIYLLLTKRLFGLRGGRAAHEAQRHEANLIEVREAAAGPANQPAPDQPAPDLPASDLPASNLASDPPATDLPRPAAAPAAGVPDAAPTAVGSGASGR